MDGIDKGVEWHLLCTVEIVGWRGLYDPQKQQYQNRAADWN